ncbi:androgen-induced gene 1 protein [Halyomorpha halys]|uniref:androgen-induced gene 1 protein n=1 Tax=Halyomorpha halys TaxID=286706 RepID=UPI0006D4CB71|nr:androgen-induced gene 1 protein-like [Halyomorpha halys]
MEVSLYQKHEGVFKTISCIVHAVGAVHFTFGFAYDWFQVHMPKDVSPIFVAFGYKSKYVSYWGFALQTAYFILATISDILGPINKHTEEPTMLCKVRDFIECSMAFPVAMFIGITFWSFMAINRELIMPEAWDPYFPSWLNHVMHTNILIFQLLEMTTSRRDCPPKKWGLIGLSLFGGLYFTWMSIVFYVSGLWAYPILNDLGVPAMILFLTASYFTLCLFYFFGEYLNKFLWDEEQPYESPEYQIL